MVSKVTNSKPPNFPFRFLYFGTREQEFMLDKKKKHSTQRLTPSNEMSICKSAFVRCAISIFFHSNRII
jgi:hypothetical protein